MEQINWLYFLPLLFLVMLVIKTLLLSKSKPSNVTADYQLMGPLFTEAERSFYGVLQASVSDDYVVMGKVRVADIIKPQQGLDKSGWQTAFNKISSKHFDYVLCDKAAMEVKAVIELDDKSHNSKKAQARDQFLNQACTSAKLMLIRFPAQSGYQIAEVKKKIGDSLLN